MYLHKYFIQINYDIENITVGLLCSSDREEREEGLKLVRLIRQKTVCTSRKFKIPKHINWSADSLLELTPLILETEPEIIKKFTVEQLESFVDSYGSIQKFLPFDCHSQVTYSSLSQSKIYC